MTKIVVALVHWCGCRNVHLHVRVFGSVLMVLLSLLMKVVLFKPTTLGGTERGGEGSTSREGLCFAASRDIRCHAQFSFVGCFDRWGFWAEISGRFDGLHDTRRHDAARHNTGMAFAAGPCRDRC